MKSVIFLLSVLLVSCSTPSNIAYLKDDIVVTMDSLKPECFFIAKQYCDEKLDSAKCYDFHVERAKTLGSNYIHMSDKDMRIAFYSRCGFYNINKGTWLY